MSENTQSRFPLEAEVLQGLDSLALLRRRPMASGRPGRRRSPLAGSSMEFADYRRYAPGDDFRRIDWRAYARLERLFLRVFEAEENLTVTVLIDCSDSMHHGKPVTVRDRKSTRLNSSHGYISYAVFCLKKKRMRNTLRPGASRVLHLAHRSTGYTPLS